MEQRNDYLGSQIEMLSKVLRKLLEKILKLNPSENIENEILAEPISHNLSLSYLLQMEEDELLNTLTVKHEFTNNQVKLMGDILFEYSNKIGTDKNIYRKAKILYQYYQANELKNIDFTIFSRLAFLERKIESL